MKLLLGLFVVVSLSAACVQSASINPQLPPDTEEVKVIRQFQALLGVSTLSFPTIVPTFFPD